MRVSYVALTLAGLTAFCLAQDVFNPARTYKLDEKDTYGLNLKMVTGQYDVTIQGKLVYTVKKVYSTGDADIESASQEMTVNVMGQEMKQPASAPRVVRHNKYGVPLDKPLDNSKPQPLFMNFLSYRPAVSMKLGETVKVDEQLDDKAKTKVKGTVKLESLSDGIAKIISSLDVTQVKGKKPMHIDSISYVDVATSKLNRAESKLINVDSSEMQGLPDVNSITVVVEREK